MSDRRDGIEVVDQERLKSLVNVDPPNTYENYYMGDDVTFTLAHNVAASQSEPKKQGIMIMIQMSSEAMAVANLYAHLPDKRNSDSPEVGKAIFFAFGLQFSNIAGLYYPLYNSSDWDFQENGLLWSNWMLNVYIKAAALTAILRDAVDLPHKVHENPEAAAKIPSSAGRSERLSYANHVNAVAI